MSNVSKYAIPLRKFREYYSFIFFNFLFSFCFLHSSISVYWNAPFFSRDRNDMKFDFSTESAERFTAESGNPKFIATPKGIQSHYEDVRVCFCFLILIIKTPKETCSRVTLKLQIFSSIFCFVKPHLNSSNFDGYFIIIFYLFNKLVETNHSWQKLWNRDSRELSLLRLLKLQFI